MAAPYPPNPYGPGAGMQPRPMTPSGPQGVRGPRQGVSKAVPVVVAAGLAVGVFCGLLFGLGTGAAPASAGPSKGNNLKTAVEKEAVPMPGAAPAGTGATAVAPPPTPDAGTARVAGGSAAPAAAAGAAPIAVGSGTGSAVVGTKLTIEVEPAAAAAIAKITVDGKDLTGTSLDVTPDQKAVRVSVSAAGYHSIDNKKVEIVAGTEMKVQFDLVKRAAAGSPGFGGASTTPNRVPTAPPKPPKPKKPTNSGIIDI